MSSKPRAAVSRETVRNKPATSTVPNTTRITRATAASRSNAVPQLAPTTTTMKKANARKPLLNRDNSPDTREVTTGRKANAPSVTKLPTLKATKSFDLPSHTDREPIKAFLRLRPQLGENEPSSEPYLDQISDTSVRMTDPYSSSHTRMSSVNPSSIYTFSHIFPPETLQADFFNKTTLPLVKDLLEGQSGLLFTYGVTNSGKTYTIQGGTEEGSAGILPRTLDVIFNSIDGLHGDGRFRPVRLNGIEWSDGSSDPISPHLAGSSTTPALADILEDFEETEIDSDSTTLRLDRNHEYTVWLSYSEVYNEKVYDLFASVEAPDSPSQPSSSGIPRPTSTFLSLPLPSSQSNPLLLTRKALPVKSCPSSDSGLPAAEAGNAGKYVAGLRQIRVRSAKEAKALLKLGQMHRRVFGTLANSQSSRSHALVTIKVLRVHRGERNDPSSIQTSRLTLVDLAGSERTKHTHTSGDRLREAGNINKSLMVLGQCMETLRANQRQVARSLAQANGRMDTREVKKGLAVVPFRHSKLTEVLMDYFVGEGKAVMIVNVNPYDTGFDENSHVMKFAALAREVCTVPATAVTRALPPVKHRPDPKARDSEVVPHRRKVTISVGGRGRKASEAHLEVLEEDEEPNGSDGDGDDEPINPLVDALFDEIERLRAELYEAEMRCAVVEADTREEVMEEMEERMRSMEKMFKRRLIREVEHHERKMDAKIDMMNQTRLRRPAQHIHSSADETEEEDQTHELESIEQDVHAAEAPDHSDSEASPSPSPLARKGTGKAHHGVLRAINPDPTSSEYESDRGHITDVDEDTATQEDDYDDDDDESILPPETQSSDDDAEEMPTPPRPARTSRSYHTSTNTKGKGKKHDLPEAPSPIFEADVKAGRAAPRRKSSRAAATSGKLAALERGLQGMSIRESARDSTATVMDVDAPHRTAREDAADADAEYMPLKDEVGPAKKKKRQLGKGRGMTDDQMAAIILGTSQDGSRQLRRSGRH